MNPCNVMVLHYMCNEISNSIYDICIALDLFLARHVLLLPTKPSKKDWSCARAWYIYTMGQEHILCHLLYIFVFKCGSNESPHILIIKPVYMALCNKPRGPILRKTIQHIIAVATKNLLCQVAISKCLTTPQWISIISESPRNFYWRVCAFV